MNLEEAYNVHKMVDEIIALRDILSNIKQTKSITYVRELSGLDIMLPYDIGKEAKQWLENKIQEKIQDLENQIKGV